MERVLDVRQGELCWVAGTVYMDMPLKPNILEDLTKEVGILTWRYCLIWDARADFNFLEFHTSPGPPTHIS